LDELFNFRQDYYLIILTINLLSEFTPNEPNAASDTHFSSEEPIFYVADQSSDSSNKVNSKQNKQLYWTLFHFYSIEKENAIKTNTALDEEDTHL
jgi:hypothetical protein